MIYFKKNNNRNIIEKYKITFDKDKVEKLKNEIIDNCSFVEHKEYKGDYDPKFTDEIIRNYKATPTGEEKEYFEETRDVYLYSYDEYIPPHLVKLLDRLLKNDPKVIDEISNYDVLPEESSIDNKINSVAEEFIKTDSENIKEKKSKLKVLEDLLTIKELNKNKQNIDSYYSKLIELLNFELIDTLSIYKLNEIESFFETELKDEKTFSDFENIKSKIRK